MLEIFKDFAAFRRKRKEERLREEKADREARSHWVEDIMAKQKKLVAENKKKWAEGDTYYTKYGEPRWHNWEFAPEKKTQGHKI